MKGGGGKGTVTFLRVRKGLDGTAQHGIKGVLIVVGMHFILMWVRQFKPLKDSHVNWSSYSVVGNIFPLCDLGRVIGWRPYLAFCSVFKDAGLQRG